MSEASGDPLYRSDTRTAPTGSQQADLAPVNDQPDEHWEQQAEARSAEGSTPIDPMGAQPPPEFDTSTDRDGAQTSPAQPEEAAASTAAPSQPALAVANGAPPPQSEESHNENHAGAATIDHEAHIPIGGELAWSDPQGDHVRSAEISVDASQATTVGSAVTMADEGDAVAQGALVQAASAANGAIALVQANLATGPLTQITDLASSLQSGASALQQVDSALGDVQGTVGSLTETVATTASDAGALLSETLDGVTSLATDALDTGGINDLTSEGLLSGLDGALDDVALPGGLTGAMETAAPTGLLASLFTPQDTDTPTDSLLDTGLTDTLGGFDAGGLLGGPDDHPHLDLPGL